MREMMIDLETRDTIPSAIIQSVGAVVWESKPTFDYEVIERLYRKPYTEDQEAEGRTQSIATMKWWSFQDIEAFNEAFSTHDRVHIEEVWRDLLLLASAHNITRFWASPCTFDFPILGDFQRMFGLNEIWSYNQMYDVRTVVLESGLSVKGHVLSREIEGKAHMPVTDCEYQIDLLTAARRKLKLRRG